MQARESRDLTTTAVYAGHAVKRARGTRAGSRAVAWVGAALALALLAGCGSSSSHAASPGGSAASVTRRSVATAPTTLPVVSATGPTTAGTTNPAATGSILMVKLVVGDLGQAQRFYGDVFGAKEVYEVGGGAHILTFPKGGPGLVLLKAGQAGNADQKGAFIVQVPSLATAEGLALANGAKKQGDFAGAPGGQAAKSVDLLDPWGNQIEILQLG